jgi:micrococcal nuclease
LGVVLVNGVDVNSKMVEDGWAWHFKKYSDDENLAALEKEARAAKRGLWQDPNPMSPWDFRERQKTKPEGVAVKYWLNSSSDIRHNHNCKFYNNTKKGRACSANDGKACKICGG